MRTALIAALRRTVIGTPRAELPLAGRTVLARQVDWLRSAGCDRILCLCERIDGEVLRLQHEVEASGGTFEALRGFIHLPALVRADDELVILADGLLPDPSIASALIGSGTALPPVVATLPATSPLVMLHPDDFERIDAQRHWAGLLVMRGAPVQHLADFPPDSDAISLLLRLALQAGIPCHQLPGGDPDPQAWLLAYDEGALTAQEHALIIRAAGETDWYRPADAIAAHASRVLVPRALARGPLIAVLGAAVLQFGGLAAAVWGAGAAGLALAGCGALAAAVAVALGRMRRDLLGEGRAIAALARIDLAVDGLTAAVLLTALSPAGTMAPLAMLGPVLIGLARLTAPMPPLAMVADRVVLPAALSLAAVAGFLPHATALLSLLLLGGLLLHRSPD